MVDSGAFVIGEYILLIDVSNYDILSKESSIVVEVVSEKCKHLIPVENITCILAGMPNYFEIRLKDKTSICVPYSEQNGKALREANLITC